MKTIGLLGGMSWESTASYYKTINKGVKQALGGLHSAKIVLYSVDFAVIEKLQHANDWETTAELLSSAARRIEAGGADFMTLCTNTMHKVAPQIEEATSIPLLHIADATGEQLVADGIKTAGLLGTRFTMEQGFYKGRIRDIFGIDVLVPTPADREIVHKIIYDELCLGIIDAASRRQFLDIIDQLNKDGAEAVILGCTEIAMLVNYSHTSVPLYDTTSIHANAAVQYALKES